MIGPDENAFSLVPRFPDAKVTVFGDYCLDAYWEIDENVLENSLETGLPVRRVKRQRYSLGGAGSVVANLVQMGVGSVRIVGLRGSDIFGEKLQSLLAATGSITSGLIADAGWETMVYAKPMLGERETNRIDFGSFNNVSPGTLDLLLGELESAIKQSDVVVLNQQVECSFTSPATIQRINQLISANPNVTFVADSRHYSGCFQGAVLKLNHEEAARLLSQETGLFETDKRATEIALELSRKIGKPVLLTRGERGIIVAGDESATLIPGLQVIEATDTVGAGDAVVAALAAGLAVGASPVSAAVIANVAAMITVKKLGVTGTASAAEILAAVPDLNYVFNPDLAESERHARYLPDTEFEVVTKVPDDLAISHVIFDHDGTLSTLREGWEQVMEPMMLRAILGAHYDTVEESRFHKVREAVRQLIDRTTGIQTLVQMKGLVGLVREYGFVPELDILDEHGYKHIFNVQLLEKVNARIEKLRKGELKSADFQIVNAEALLKELHDRGVKLYLASGTDQADVIAEAEAMGYARYFEGRIFGAIGKIDQDAKRHVLENIIRENGLLGHQFATFGDGPVEMRETERRGGLCIGVASDELRRFGLNLSKRKRLIRAGADLIIPDFSQLDALLVTLQLGGKSSANFARKDRVMQ